MNYIVNELRARREIVEKLRAQRDQADDWRTTLAEQAADEIDRLNKWAHGYYEETRAAHLKQEQEIKLLLTLLGELFALVKGESPALLDYDRGGEGDLELAIESALKINTPK